MINKTIEIEKECGYHHFGKCLCVDKPLTDPMCQFCKYYPYGVKEQEREREEN